MELHLNPAGNVEEQISQGAVEGALIAADDDLADEDDDDQEPQGVKDEEGALVLPQFLFHGLPEVLLFSLFFALLRLLAEFGHGDLLLQCPYSGEENGGKCCAVLAVMITWTDKICKGVQGERPMGAQPPPCCVRHGTKQEPEENFFQKPLDFSEKRAIVLVT